MTSSEATTSVTSLLADIEAAIGPDKVLTGAKKISRYLRDFSWYSPILENEFSDTTVDAVIKPVSIEELTTVVSLAARHRVPLTLRGAGTGNYGQSLPLEEGIVVDIKGIAGVLDISEGRISLLPGTVMKTADQAARDAGQEIAVMPSTYRVATAAGHVCGGSGGIGSAENGDNWSNDNILAVEMITVEEQPRTIRLEGDDVFAVLHTYGTIGVLTRIEYRLVPAREYEALILVFPNFEDAINFGWHVVDSPIHLRLTSFHQAPIGSMFTPIADLYPADAHIALLWSDVADHAALEELAAEYSAQLIAWPEDRQHITQFPYSHTILWSRRAHPESSWLQCEYAYDDLDRARAQVAALTERYPGVFLQNMQFIKSTEGRVRTMACPSIVGLENYTDALEQMIDFCGLLDIKVLNPHSYVVDEGGFVGNAEQLVELKRECDPYGILNPGKLGTSFFAERGGVAAGRDDFDSPEQLDKITNITTS